MPPKQKLQPSTFGFIALAFAIGFIPILPIWYKGSPLLINDLLVAYFDYFADFHRNWSWSHPLPLWSSSYQCGMPMHAYWQTGYLYPLTWVLFGPFDPLHTIYPFYAIHFGLAIAGFLVLGPQLGLIRLTSFWSGLVFGLSGTLLARYEHTTFLVGWCYLPLLLGLYLRLEKSPTYWGIVQFAFVLSLQTLGGHPQATIATALLLGMFFFRGLCDFRLPRKNFWAPVISVCLALLICLPLFIPFFDLLNNTNRYDGANWEGKAAESVFRFEKFTTGSLRPVHLLSLILPHALGSPAHATWWGGEPWTEVFLSLGSVAFLLCLFISIPHTGPRIRWLWLCGMLGLWLAFGALLGASQLLYNIPILNSFRRPSRWMVLFVLAMAALSGHGLQRWLGRKSSNNFGFVAISGMVLFLFSFVFTFPGFSQKLLSIAHSMKHLDASKDYSDKVLLLIQDWRWDFFWLTLGAAILALRRKLGLRLSLLSLFVVATLDLTRLHWQHFYQFPSDFYRTPPRTLAVMDLKTKPFWRVAHYLEYPGTEMWQMHHAPLRRPDLFEREKLALSYGVHALFGIQNIGAHMPLLWSWSNSLTAGEKSARYFLSNRDLTKYHGSPIKPIAQVDSVRVYEVLDWKPRLELRKGPHNAADSDLKACPQNYSGYGGLCVFEPRDGALVVKCDFQVGDILVFREHWHRGWRVKVGEGEWVKPERMGPFMAMSLKREAHTVEWKF